MLGFVLQSIRRCDTMLFLVGLLLTWLSGIAPNPLMEQGFRIVGGNSINITEAPYQISLLYFSRHICGGTIVARDIIITAAHCVKGSTPSDLQVRAGSSSSLEGGQVVQVGDLAAHPDYNYQNMNNDIAVIWLAYPLKFTAAVRPVRMLNPGEEVPDGELTVVTGWGAMLEGGSSIPYLQKVLVPKVGEAECTAAYGSVYNISSQMLCAGALDGGKDACKGDSGGPLVYKNKLAGVVSWGNGCARPHFLGVYTKVAAFRPWVDRTISFIRLRHIVMYLRPE